MLAVMLASLLPYPRWSLVFVTDAWRGETRFFFWETSRGGRNLMGEKREQKLNLWQSCEFFFFDKKTHICFFREEFPEKGTSCMGIFFSNGKLSEFLIDFEWGG